MFFNHSATKVGLVFDASAHERSSPSLNDCLNSECNEKAYIFSLLYKFRLYKICVKADIKRAFLQVSVNPAAKNL